MSATTNGKAVFPPDARGAAEMYLAHGLAPIALPTRSKGAGLPEGWQHTRLSAADLDRYFPAGHVCNVGVLNGLPSHNHVDVDLDCPEAIRASTLLPPTGMEFGRAGAPRSHRIYHVDRDLDTASIEFRDINGKMIVELRGTGGLTVVPPSIHKETGENIVWHRFDQPAELPLDALRRAVSELATAALIACHWPARGSRDEAAMALHGGLIRTGWDERRVSAFVYAIAVAAQDDEPRMRAEKARGTAAKLEAGKKVTGWPKLAEVIGQDGEAIVRQAREWLGLVSLTKQQTSSSPAASTPRPRTVPPYRPFPVDVLPGPLAEYVRHGAEALRCDPSYLALPCISAVGSLIGNTRTIRLKRGWDEPSLFWTAIVGDSGTLKSPAYRTGIGYLFRKQRLLIEEHKKKMAEYTNEMQNWKEAKKAHKDGKGDDPGEEPDKPTLRRIVCADTTIEKLAEILDDNPCGTLVARDELAGWLGSISRYKSGGASSDLPNWLEMYQAGTIMVDRKTGERPTLFIHRATVSIVGGIQPGVLSRALTPEFLDAGLAARLLMAMPPKLPKVWSEREVPLTVEQAYHSLLDTLLTLEFDVKDGEKVPHVVRLSKEAKRAWIAFYNAWAQEQAAAEGELAAAFSKLEGYAARFALLHHVVTRLSRLEDDTADVEVESIEAGVTFSRWCAEEARRIYTTLSESEDERNARRLVEYIRSRGGEITARELQKSNSRKYPESEHAQEALDALAAAGFGHWIEPAPSKRGGQPARRFTLLPTPDTTDSTDNGPHGGDDNEPPSAPDTTPDSTQATPCFPGESGTNVGSVEYRLEETVDTIEMGSAETREGGIVGQGEGVSDNDGFMLVTDPAGLAMVQSALDSTSLVGVDTETTGLNPRHDRVRLLSLATDTVDGGAYTYLVDCFRVDPSLLWDLLAEKKLVFHNAVFDLGFRARMGFTPAAKVNDTMLLSRVLYAGARERHGLEDCVKRELGQTLDKGMQRSNWTGTLTREQLDYAARDAVVLRPLLTAISAKIGEAELGDTAALERRALPAVVWMASKGVAVDRAAWSSLAVKAKDTADSLRQQMADLAPVRPGEMFATWNFDSPADVLHLFATLGLKVESTDDETLSGIDHRIAGLMRQYREATKKTGTYGIAWLKHIAGDGRVYPSWNSLGAEVTGRMSCSDPNMQQIPRDKAYRQCIAAPAGRVLVKADYSQIELRIAAKVSRDQAMLKAYQDGLDLHTLTARAVLGVEDVTKEHRQLAKSLNFGLLYGMGAPAFRQYAATEFGVKLTDEQAQQYRAAFFKSYPGLRAWHNKIGKTKDEAIVTRTLAGRRRLDVGRFTEKLNTPVQGTGGDGIKLALALLWERRQQMPTAFPVLAVHDEIVLEADAGQADAAAAWLRQAMLDAMMPLIEPVPVEVEVQIGRTWGGDTP